jgi:hypothetical protein
MGYLSRTFARRALSFRAFLLGILIVSFFTVLSNWIGRYHVIIPFVQDFYKNLDPAIVGIILPWFLGIVTVSGFLLTLGKVLQLHDRITTFEDFLGRANRIIDEARRNHEVVRIICHSPPIGNLTIPEAKEFTEFNQKLNDPVCKFQFVCLTVEHLKRFYKSYTTRVKGGKDFVEKQLNNAIDICEAIEKKKHDRSSDCAVYPQLYENIPHFYLVFHSKRAIIAPVFFLPGFLENGDGRDNAHEVEIYGFETTEKLILKKCENAFNYYKDLRYEGEAPQVNNPSNEDKTTT